MATIGRLWAGRLYGTNTGNLAVELNAADDGLQGTIRFMDDRYGPIVYHAKGKFENGRLSFEAVPEAVLEGQSAGTITASAMLLDNGNLKGEWSRPLGRRHV